MMRKCRLNRPSGPFSRLEIVPRLKASLLALALTASLALGAAACGGGSDLLPGTTASEINSNLEDVKLLVHEGNCSGAEAAVAEVRSQVEGLEGVNTRLVEALGEGVGQLESLVSACEEPEGEEETEPLEEAEETDEKAEKREQREQEKSEKEAQKEQEKSEKETGTPASPTEPSGQEKQEEEAQEPQEESEAPSGGVSPGAPAGEG
jgi:phosphatidylglycerol---prolipoprotein diacylglyceryl transferase